MKKNKKLRSIDLPLYRYWQALYMAFYSPKLYVDVVKRWRGLGLIYFLILVAIVTIPLSLRISINLHHYFTTQFLTPFQNIPEVIIQDGRAKFDKPMPYFIKNKFQEVIGIIDTTGEYLNMNTKFSKLSVLITQDKFYFRPPAFQLFAKSKDIKFEPLHVESFNSVQDEIFIGEKWVKSKSVQFLIWSVIIAIYPSIMLFLYTFFVTFLLMLSVLGQVYALFIFKYKISYMQVCRLTMVASTPLIFIYLMLLAFNQKLYGAGLTSLILFSLYFSFGLLAAKRESQRMVHA